ncbi:MAG: 50S ribosomal protein L15 [Desulfobacteraceae bacterium]|jgi:large subunit ribosomal protein L15|uniref:Large ribosomal subunit protein uL15 n=1 Tax=Candidatus Desulfatibia vada TaxID=2841696 RepID=A0A8J6TKL1_9BACT|nr:50S ribosomal protein L15 [Candidatus Desulfatibia vada]MBL6971258.1 50S ribosomal protein L15 [Desulfobacterales bacterium]NQT70605.1 50S ribosomal protein L15 [Desulfobacteraceae bacterium]
MKLNELSPPAGSRRPRKRLGRGVGSGTGKTAGRGTKGQNSRSGGGVRPGFEGGQMPIHRRLPKRGFTNIFKKKIAVVNIRDLSKFESGSVVDEIELVRMGLVKGRRDGVKLLAQGKIDIPLTVKVHAASRGAIEKIKAAGGEVEVI